MLSVTFICVGKMRERFYTDAFAEYAKRLGAYCRFTCVEPAEIKLPEKPSQAEMQAALAKEAVDIVKYIPQDAYVVAMCVEGRQMPSEGMARLIQERENSGKPKLCFLIGGSYGLADSVKDRADLKLSMSEMTFPHHLARVILAEQLYRGFKIREGSRYHK
ncbi:MAG: 23S rRNA (pseudouridine(1915)-N(3))-methyltransferase RlmH [Oscillospiraceae bacterium]|nr:23S rRNA (pseudouridine(1915)-N(3))-methyltransferase RlmH [Oscillospiraceae bacterium]